MIEPMIYRRLGLPKHSGEVHLYLNEVGPAIAAHIAEALGIHRPVVYRTLEALIEHGFVVIEERGARKYYVGLSEQKVAERFDELTSGVSRGATKKRDVTDLIPGITVFVGAEGVTKVFDDAIDRTPRGGTIYRYTSERDLDKVNSYLSADYRERRDKKKIERLVISNPTSAKQKRSRLERFIAEIPSSFDMFQQDIIQLVYADRIAFIDLSRERSFVIENKELAEFQKVIFRMLYRKLVGKK